MLSAEGFRIPLPDYSVAVSDARYQQRLTDSIHRHPWLLKTIFKQTTPENLLLAARSLRREYTEQLNLLFEAGAEISGYERKRVIPKIRYLAGRLLYLETPEDLNQLSIRLQDYSELHVLAEIMRSLVSRDVTRLLSLGSNSVQVATQALKIDGSELKCNVESWGAAQLQGLAILRAHGLAVSGPIDDELNRFALWQEGHSLMVSENVSIQEIACLHGVTTSPRHKSMLDTAFDRGEQLAFDAATPVETY